MFVKLTKVENDEAKMKSEESSYQVENYSTKTEKSILSKTSNDGNYKFSFHSSF